MTVSSCFTQNLEVSLPAGEAVKALEKWLALGEESWSLKCPDWKGKAHFSSIFNSSSFARWGHIQSFLCGLLPAAWVPGASHRDRKGSSAGGGPAGVGMGCI